MRKLLLFNALWALLVASSSVGIATAQVREPEEWGGHGQTQCEPVTHASYYDLRHDYQGVGNQDEPNGDNVYYVDTNPMSDFRPDGDYDEHPPSHNCDGTPIVRATAYVAVTVQGELWLQDQHQGFPGCMNTPSYTRNPGCRERKTGVYAGFYAAEADNSNGFGQKGGVSNPWSEDDGSNLP